MVRLVREDAGLVAVVLIMAIATGADGVWGKDWPNFRGPNHDGISVETGLRVQWNSPIPMVWERDLGSAFSSFSAVQGRVYTCGTKDKMQVLYCLEANTGKTIWQLGFEKEYRDSNGDGSRATPSVSDGRVYILGARGRLVCADATDGHEIWDQQFDSPPRWGYSGSVLIEGELAIAPAGGSAGAIVALDRASGEPVWSCGTGAAGYATPYPFTFEGRRYVVGFLASEIVVADVVTGAMVWQHSWPAPWKVNAASPVFHDGYLFVSTGNRQGCAVFKLAKEQDGLSGKQVWKSRVLQNKFQSCILHEGKLYSSDQKGFKCVDFLTGKEHWQIKRANYGTIILAQDNLLFFTQDGQLQIGPVSPDRFVATTKADLLTGRCWTVPMLYDGKIYVRNLDRVACFDLSP